MSNIKEVQKSTTDLEYKQYKNAKKSPVYKESASLKFDPLESKEARQQAG